MPAHSRFPWHWVAALPLMGLAGCARDGDIAVYTVARDSVSATDSTLGAMVPQGKQAWFFKLSGPRGQVDGLSSRFEEFVKTVRVPPDGGTPTWTLLEGWKQRSGDQMRFATIDVPVDGKTLELTISRLPMQSQGEEEYLLANLNRWRSQLSLPRIGRSQLGGEIRKVDIEGGTASLTQLTGKLKKSPGGDMPMMGMGGGGPTSVPAEKSDIKHAVPEGWQRSAGNSLSLLSYEVVDGDRRVETTLTRLTVEAGQLLPNVNRWRGQVNLPPFTAEELSKAVVKVPCGQSQADFVELLGPAGDQGARAILGVIAITGDASWFFKLTGDTELAQREKAHFLEFVKSTELE